MGSAQSVRRVVCRKCDKAGAECQCGREADLACATCALALVECQCVSPEQQAANAQHGVAGNDMAQAPAPMDRLAPARQALQEQQLPTPKIVTKRKKEPAQLVICKLCEAVECGCVGLREKSYRQERPFAENAAKMLNFLARLAVEEGQEDDAKNEQADLLERLESLEATGKRLVRQDEIIHDARGSGVVVELPLDAHYAVIERWFNECDALIRTYFIRRSGFADEKELERAANSRQERRHNDKAAQRRAPVSEDKDEGGPQPPDE